MLFSSAMHGCTAAVVCKINRSLCCKPSWGGGEVYLSLVYALCKIASIVALEVGCGYGNDVGCSEEMPLLLLQDASEH